ncbi:hypothetical protein [Photobacterium leiognathi]|uniref:hypothetical protein n=1 Tax=Photobacterium leiognathi TaxID=553611 RepID=UPI002980EAF1|nr:hypothetical protein [Photobacterium leiognathi]
MRKFITKLLSLDLIVGSLKLTKEGIKNAHTNERVEVETFAEALSRLGVVGDANIKDFLESKYKSLRKIFYMHVLCLASIILYMCYQNIYQDASVKMMLLYLPMLFIFMVNAITYSFRCYQIRIRKTGAEIGGRLKDFIHLPSEWFPLKIK